MQIGQAARASGVSAKMIRHYEAIGLIGTAHRRNSNYRAFDSDDVHRLGFIRRARSLGFSVDQIRELLRLWSDRDRSSADVKAIAAAHLGDLEHRISELRAMSQILERLVCACEGDERPHCPIIEGLEGVSNDPGRVMRDHSVAKI